MTQVRLSLKDGKWVEDPNSDFMLHEKLRESLDKVKRIQKKGFDAVLLFDGMERIGKSTLAMMCGWYLSNGTLGINNFARGLKDVARKIQLIPDKSVLILDEGSLIFNSKSGMTKPVKALLKLMDVVGQKNLIFMICNPSFFDLVRQIAVRRSKFLVSLKVDEEYNRGDFYFWGEYSKRKLYTLGKKKDDDYNAWHYDWNGKFTEWHTPWYEEYKEIVKKESLAEAIEECLGVENGNNEDTLKGFVYRSIELWRELGKTHEEIAQMYGLSRDQVAKWWQRYGQEVDTTNETGQPLH